jgi:hypothetical protein
MYLLAQDELRGLLADLWYEVSDEQLARTVDTPWHLPGSTLSSVVTAWILARYTTRSLAIRSLAIPAAALAV